MGSFANLQNISIQYPWSILWLLPVLLIFTLIIYFKKTNFISNLLRLILLFVCLLALTNPQKIIENEISSISVLIDVSYSIPEEAYVIFSKKIKEILEAKSNLKINLWSFAKNVSDPILIDQSYSQENIFTAIKEAKKDLDSGETDIGTAINHISGFSDSSAILLFSDGNETAGQARSAAEFAAAANIKIFPYVLDSQIFTQPKLKISAITTPTVADSGTKVDCRVAVNNPSSITKTAYLEIYDNEKMVYGNQLAIPANNEKLIVSEFKDLVGGLHKIRALIYENNKNAKSLSDEQNSWISVKEKEKILLISGSTDDHRIISQIISLKGYSMEDIVTERGKNIPASLTNFSSVVLNNVPKQDLSDEFLENLKKFSALGGGVILIGGDRSFGLGGFVDTAVEQISPLKFKPPQTTKKRLNNAVILVLDKSRSMNEGGKINAAKSAAMSSILSLKDNDYIGVIGFDATPFVIIRTNLVSEVKDGAEHRLRNLTPAGQTNPLPALAAARQSLQSIEAGRKHVILMSDGKFPIAGQQYEDELARFNQLGITLSSVALGGEGEVDIPLLRMFSQIGKGSFYHTEDAGNLPQIFIRDIKVSTGEKTLIENQDFPVVLGPSGLLSTNTAYFPVLTGFVETEAKKEANLELLVQKEGKAYPLLASWKYEKGSVIAFTSDANGRWSLPWLRWKPFAKFWTDILNFVRGTSEENKSNIDFDFRYALDKKELVFDLAIFDTKLQSESAPPISGEIVDPSGDKQQVSFVATRKGRFSASAPNARPGDYKISIKYGDLSLPPLALTIPADSFGEQRGQGINNQNLSNIAHLSGGTINPQTQGLITTTKKSSQAASLFRPLALVSFFLVLIEAFWREGVIRFLLSKLARTKKVPVSRKPRGKYQ